MAEPENRDWVEAALKFWRSRSRKSETEHQREIRKFNIAQLEMWLGQIERKESAEVSAQVSAIANAINASRT